MRSFKKATALFLCLLLSVAVLAGVPFGAVAESPYGSVLVETEDTLGNGSSVYKVAEGGGNVTLDSNIADFTLKFKYTDVAKNVTNPECLYIKMRGGKYTVAIHPWATAKDNDVDYTKSNGLSVSGSFEGGATSAGGNGQFSLADNKWAEFKIVMSGNKLVILKDGKLWQDLTLTDEGTAGALEMKFSGKYDTYVSDISVTTPTEQDLYTVVDADFKSEVYSDEFCNIPISYDATTDKAKIPYGTWNSYTIAQNIGEYEFSVDLSYDAINGVRGFGLDTPAGNRYIFVADALYDYNGNNWKANYGGVNLNTSNVWHSVKLSMKDGVEKVYLDGKNIYTANVATVTAGDFNLVIHTSVDVSYNENVYLKNLKLTKADSISRSDIAVFPTLDESFDFAQRDIFGYGWSNTNWASFVQDGVKGAKVISHKSNGNTPMFDETTLNENMLFGFKFYMNSGEANGNKSTFYVRRDTSADTKDRGFTFTFTHEQCYVEYCSETESINKGYYFRYDNTKYFDTSVFDRWIDVEFFIYGKNLTITVDGRVLCSIDDVHYDDANKHSLLWTQADQNIYVAIADIKLQSLGGLKKAVDSTAAVTFDENGVADSSTRAQAISAGEKLFYNIDKTYLRNNTNYLEVYYDYGDVNTDGNTDICDMVRLNKIIGASENATVKSDINRDGNHEAADLTLLRNYILG